MYNNDVTYNKKWDTPENKEYNRQVYDILKDRTMCFSDCPLAWSKEVLEFLVELDKEFGIGYNAPYELSLRSYLNKFFESFKIFVEKLSIYETLPDDIMTIQIKKFKKFFDHQKFHFKRFYMTYKRRLVNKIQKPKIYLSQVKEKYGRLEIYFSAPEYIYDYIEKKKKEVEVKLAVKGAYFKLEEMYKWRHQKQDNTGTKIEKTWFKHWNTGKRVYSTYISYYPYRKIMNELDPVTFKIVKSRIDKKKINR